jgi:two-component system response regulator DevR
MPVVKPMTVLIADDSDAFVQRLVAVLADVEGLEIIGRAGTVREASRAVQTLKPDVMILDLQMPGGSGIDVLAGLEPDRATPIVIVLTNHPYRQYRKKCLESGARFFIDKSTEFERVGPVLSGLIHEASREPEAHS